MKRLFKIADLFCGAGGSSTGARRAIRALAGEMDLVAVNHSAVAVATHKKNHPHARHYVEDVNNVDPVEVVGHQGLHVLMASPECRFFSSALGGRPVRDQGRMNPWIVVKWITAVPVDTVLVENVAEIVNWGPTCTLPDGHGGHHRDVAPSDVADADQCARVVPETKGIYFQAWVKAIWEAGYSFEWRVLNAADFGDATTRRRFFGIGRRNHGKIRWPDPSHRNPDEPANGMFDSRPVWRAAREIIDWADLGDSMLTRKEPLSVNTRRRVAAGLSRYGGVFAEQLISLLDLPDDVMAELKKSNGRGKRKSFVFSNRNHNAPRDPDTDPISTITTAPACHYLVSPTAEPFTIGQHTGSAAHAASEPLPALTTVARIRLLLPAAEPLILGQHGGSVARSQDQPVPTITTDGALSVVQPVAQIIVPYYGTGVVDSPDEPLATITAKPRFGLGQALIVPYRDKDGVPRVPHTAGDPLTTITSGGKQHGLAQAVIVPYGPAAAARTAEEPLPTIMTKDRLGAAFPDAYMIDHFGERPGENGKAEQAPRARGIDQPTSTITSRGAGTLVQPLLHSINAPLYSITDNGAAVVAPILVPVESIDGIDPRRLAVVDGQLYVLDIRYRMLKNRELARAMGFDDAELEYEFTGTQTQITRQIGNAVSVATAQALVGAIIAQFLEDEATEDAA